MFKVKAYLKSKLVMEQSLPHLPRCGDSVCFGNTSAIVDEVIWSLDEDHQNGKDSLVTLVLEPKSK